MIHPLYQGKPLTVREVEVMQLLISDGSSNKVIGRELGITESTVKNHLERIFWKLGATTRVQAVLAFQRKV
jgi:DNA-binding NarL/FixJ family response regulator